MPVVCLKFCTFGVIDLYFSLCKVVFFRPMPARVESCKWKHGCATQFFEKMLMMLKALNHCACKEQIHSIFLQDPPGFGFCLFQSTAHCVCFYWEGTLLPCNREVGNFFRSNTNRFHFRFSLLGRHFNCKRTFLCCFNQQKMRVAVFFFFFFCRKF